MDKLKQVLSGRENEEETGIMGTLNEASTLSWETRIKGFAICFVVGILFTLLASFALFLNRGLTVFAAFYTIGNILSLLSTCFLMGPVKQIKKMFSSTRWIATCIMLASLVLTLVAALVLKKALLALLFIIIQGLAMTWYSLSYIPYARDAVKKTFNACIDV
ncbi:vesicle transport protein SFT2A isoform X1 [Culicoides brevitarsis]|uniref:vesicle transport protein SFT2A isoform X1 n=1 Tax=Culicoides brevitarsis TaxID=469753 RepID=UPI00307C9DA3